MSIEIEITVLKYDIDFTKRTKDIKKNTWFSFPNDLLLHPDFSEINGEELKWFFWIVSICSKLNKNKVRINMPHTEKILDLNRSDLFSMVKKLQGKQIDIAYDQTATERDQGATVCDQTAASTLHYITDTTLQDTTLQNITCSELKVPNLPNISKKEIVSINFSENRKINLTKELINSWADTYPKEYLDMEFKKARSWVLSNEHKAPKKNWGTFLNNWLNRGWDQYRKTLTSNPVKVTVEDLNELLGGLS